MDPGITNVDIQIERQEFLYKYFAKNIQFSLFGMPNLDPKKGESLVEIRKSPES